MQKHTKIYFDYFGYGEQDFIPCEACQSQAVEIHHIHNRGKDMDVIDNLMALCRKHHNQAHGDKNYIDKSEFDYIHKSFLAGKRIVYLK
jgi:hypothetical protein